ncbi:MAG: hypothetical protein KDK64_03235 [Chlamydiia bacterium]|nr:hypothetical protein [Chlamydiia bacterium]
MSTRVYGGGMFVPPVVISDGKYVPLKSPLEAIVEIAIDFFKWVGNLFSGCFSNSTENERRPFAHEDMHVAQRVTVPQAEVGIDQFDRSILKPRTIQYQVGTAEEPKREHFSQNPLIGEKITTTSQLHEVGKTGIRVQREVVGILQTGFARYDVVGSDGKPFKFDRDPQASIQLIANWAGVSPAEAFDGLTSSNPVSVFQILIQQHFDPTTQKEFEDCLAAGFIEGEPVRRGKLTLLPSQGDGALRYRIETDHNLMGITGEPGKSYRVTQEVTIRPGEPCQVTVERSAQAK